MCGRFRQRLSEPELRRVYDLPPGGRIVPTPKRDGLFCPGQAINTIVQNTKGRILRTFSWGFTGQDGILVYNARIETVDQKPLFYPSYRQGFRCVVPATDFMERGWNVGTGEVMHLAGIYRENEVTILTKPAEGDVARIHHRMPVILADNSVEPWLDPKTPRGTYMEFTTPNVLQAVG